MGRINVSKTIAFSGRIGPVISYVTRDGKQVFRTYTKPSNPRTPRQMAQRHKFALVIKSLSPLRAVIRRGYPNQEDAYHKLIGMALKEAVEGEYPDFLFNFSKIEIAGGLLQLSANTRMTYDPTTREARFSWDVPHQWAPASGNYNDKVIIVCLHATKHPEVITHHAGNRAQGEATITLPEGWQAAETHYWLYLTSPDMQENSKSIYLA